MVAKAHDPAQVQLCFCLLCPEYIGRSRVYLLLARSWEAHPRLAKLVWNPWL